MLQKNELIEPPPTTVLLFYDEYQSIYGKMLREKLITRAIEGVPSYKVIRETIKEVQEKSNGPTLAIFDDSKESLQSLDPLFAIGSHHLNCSALVLTQTLFSESPHLRTMSQNAHYQILMKVK